MTEREELAKYVDRAAKEAGDVGALITQTKLEMAAALLRQPAAPVQVREAMVEAALDAMWNSPGWRKLRDPNERRASMRRALEAALQAGVPSGWKMVPAKPTPEMINYVNSRCDVPDADLSWTYEEWMKCAPKP